MIIEKFRKIYILRDDLYPFPGGGNKARKALEYESFMKSNGFDSFVTTGGIQSNHCRAMAIIGARNKWKCHLVYHGEEKRFYEEKGNALLVRKMPTTYEFVESENISSAMNFAMLKLKSEGLNPYYITGGGHDLPGGIAYVKAIKELKSKCEIIKWKPNVIFLASGTGSTQAGIIAGLELIGWGDVKVIGISIARPYTRGSLVIKEFLSLLCNYLNLPNLSSKVYFNADYLFEGYETYSDEMRLWLGKIMSETGVFFDYTYSGKALWGTHNILKKTNTISNVLFWHTGGLMNLI